MANPPAGLDLAQSREVDEKHEPHRLATQTKPAGAFALSIHLIAIILVVAALYFAKAFLLPVVLAVISALILIPIVRWFARRGIPPFVTAPILVLSGAFAFAIGLLLLAPAAIDWFNRAPLIAAEMEWKLRDLRSWMDAFAQAGKQVEELTTERDPTVQEVVVREPGILATTAFTAWTVVSTLIITALLSMFLLGSGDMFYIKLIRLMPTLSDKKMALRIVQSVEKSISRYLLTVTLINSGLGVAVGMAMWALGMPNPAVWGAAAALLNFLPYLGAITGVVIVTAVSLISFDSVGQALLVPVVYVSLTTLEGQIVTPMIVGRRLEINTVSIFLGIAFWGWLWGLVGVLIAVPILVIVKRISEHLPAWQAFGEFLSSTPSREGNDDEGEQKPAG